MPKVTYKSKKTALKTTPAVKEIYIEAVGRRKTAVARVRIFKQTAGGLIVTVNDRPIEKYFSLFKNREVILAPLNLLSIKNILVTVKVFGGGLNAQAEAIRLGIARVLIKTDPENRSKLKAVGYLRRDPRMVERKKFGSRKARRPQQWRKR